MEAKQGAREEEKKKKSNDECNKSVGDGYAAGVYWRQRDARGGGGREKITDLRKKRKQWSKGRERAFFFFRSAHATWRISLTMFYCHAFFFSCQLDGEAARATFLFLSFFFWFLFPVVGPMVSLIQSCIHVCVCQRDRTFFFFNSFLCLCFFFFYFALVPPVWQSTLLVFFFFFSQLVTKQLTPAAPGTSCHLFFFLLVFKVCPAVFFFRFSFLLITVALLI